MIRRPAARPEVEREVAATVARIIADVRARGDAALRDLAREYDGVALDTLEVPHRILRDALDGLDRDLQRAMERTARNVATVHRAFAPGAQCCEPEPGILVGRRPDPLARVGVYAPGGRAAYPSSVLMAAIPAKVAGVREVIVASPPARDGRPAPAVLAAAALANVDRVFAVGGAGAIAAMAIGTQSVPRVDRVVGPGNAYVAAAKLQLVADTGIDSPAGPSELVVIADASADAPAIAREMLAQAEHDPLAAVVAFVTDERLAEALRDELAAVIPVATRAGVIAQVLAGESVVCVADLDDAIARANAYAPEHLLLAVRAEDRERALLQSRNAGAVFVGESSSVVFGDYMTGANHVLPTGGAARWYSGLSPLDFVRWTSWQRVAPDAARSLAADVACFASCEGLPAHAAAAAAWSDVA